MSGTRVEVTLVAHGFEVDIYSDSDELPGEVRVGSFCFDWGDDYDPRAVAVSLAEKIVALLRSEPEWMCKKARK